eukprot:3704533-Pyramimonas_sp.AAC.1
MADGVAAGELSASQAELLEFAPTFPSQENTAGKGRGCAPAPTASCAAHKRRALPPHGVHAGAV